MEGWLVIAKGVWRARVCVSILLYYDFLKLVIQRAYEALNDVGPPLCIWTKLDKGCSLS